MHTKLSVGGASLIENWILEGDEQGNIPENAFVFLPVVFGLIFFGAKLWVNDRVIPRKKKSSQIKLTGV